MGVAGARQMDAVGQHDPIQSRARIDEEVRAGKARVTERVGAEKLARGSRGLRDGRCGEAVDVEAEASRLSHALGPAPGRLAQHRGREEAVPARAASDIAFMRKFCE